MGEKEMAPEGSNNAGPLAGIRVIDVTTMVLGPYATQMLGDLGADVIKVEPPGGDDMRSIGPSRTPGMGSYFANLNRSKRSIVLDLKKGAGREALQKLVSSTDVFVHNMRPGAARRLKLDYASLAPTCPGLIHASASGFRKGSSREDAPAFDDLIQGMSGLAGLNAGQDGAPRYVPTVLVDKLCGMMLAGMIGMALFHRARTGQGQEVHVPMLETTLSFLLIEHLWWGTLKQPERGIGYPRMLSPNRRPYATLDGYISVIASSDAQYARLLSEIGRAELIEDPRFATMEARAANIDLVLQTLAVGLRERSTDEWLRILTAAQIPCGRAGTLSDLFNDPYLTETGFFSTQDHPSEGTVALLPFAAGFSESTPRTERLWPSLGEHTVEVLREFGLDEAEIASASGAIPN
jgi:crotonobetainyl-CoA:carnitine CoA-transferase CaiB-like acyl-CoA transferase